MHLYGSFCVTLSLCVLRLAKEVPAFMSDSSLESDPTIAQPAHAAHSWRRWLLAFDAYNLSANTLFTSAIWVIYLAAHGYSPFAIGLLETLFHLAKFVAEVPTGIFADLLGRRKSLIVASILRAIDLLLFLVPSVPMMILSFALSGISYAFLGGANQALLWGIAGVADAEQQTARYSKLISRMYLVGAIGEMIGTASGGYLGHLLTTLPFLCSFAACLLSIIPLLFIPEQQVPHQQRQNPWKHFAIGLQAVAQQPVLLGLLIIGGLIDSCWQTIYFYNQLYLNSLGFALTAIGLIVAASMLSNFLFTACAPFVMRHIPQRWLVPCGVAVEIIGVGLISVPQPVVSLLGYLVLLQASVAILDPAISTYINERSPEAQRATVLSLQTGLFSATMIVLFPLFGLGITHVAYSTVYTWTMLALAGGGLVTVGLVWVLGKGRV